MKDGLDIRVYCPDGNPGSMRCVSIPNWNGGVLYISRGYWGDAVNGEYRDQLKKSGVYILAGGDGSQDGGRKKIYIGQSENLRSRIDQHIEDSTKKFFDHAVCIIDRGDHLNSAHFKWAEASLIEKARDVGACAVENRNVPNKPKVSVADESTIKRFLEEVYRIFPMVEIDAFSKEKERQRDDLPRHFDEFPAETAAGLKLASTHKYIDHNDKIVMVVARYEKGDKQMFVPFTPRKAGGHWHAYPHNKAMPKSDRTTKYPVYGLSATRDNDHPIYIVRDEQAADIISGLTDGPHNGKPPPCVCLPDQIKLADIDFSPLAGRQVVVFAAATNESCNRARSVAKTLHDHGCAVKLVLPDGETGYDVSMAAAEGGWDGLVKWLKKFGNLKPLVTEKKAPSAKTEPAEISQSELENNEHFRVLGLRDSMLLIQKKRTSEILSFSRSQLVQSGHLITIASLDYWYDLYNGEGLTTKNKERIADSLIRAANRKGEIKDAHLFVGRGAFIDERSRKVVYNTGSKLLVAGKDGMLTVEKRLSDSTNFALPGAPITVVDDPKAHEYLESMADAVLQYRWREMNDGLAFLGWIVAAVIGGAIKFRPTLWLYANMGSGKSFLIDNVLAKLFAEMCMPIGDTTEAALVAMVKCDSLPVILDEFEPEGGQSWKKNRTNILKMLHSASTGGAGQLRISGGRTIVTGARFSALVSSRTATEGGAFPIHLSTTGVKDWFALKDLIVDSFHMDKCRAIISLIIRHTALLARDVDVLTREMATKRGMSTRRAAMCAALSVGARFFTKTKCDVVHPEQHRDSGQLDLLRELLAATAYQQDGKQYSVADCLTAGYFNEGLWVGRRSAGYVSSESTVAAGYGFGMKDKSTMLICPAAPRMKKLLANTKFANIDLAHYIRTLPMIESNQRNLRCAGQNFVAKELPLSVYQHAGFNPTATEVDDDDD